MDFTAPSFSLGLDFDDPPPADADDGGDPREEPRGYEAPDAPSFSLGLDFECYDDHEPRIPAGGRSEEPARRYEAPDAPSFSLGLGFDDDDGGAGEPQIPAGARREERPRRYEAPDAPSFSLGLDDDDGGASEPHHLPAGDRREEQAPRYEAPDAPSFSLGIDDDDDDFVAAGTMDPDPLLPQPGTNRLRRLRRGPAPGYEAPDAPSFSLGIDDGDDFVAGGALDPDPLPPQPETNRLKRLRRGPAPRSMVPPPPPPLPPRAAPPLATEASPDFSRKAAPLGDIGSYEDEIEGFSDEEPPRGMTPSVGSCRTSSNSKFSLLNRSVLMSQSTSKAKTTKSTPMSNSVASKPLEESRTKKLLPKITISPLRKIYFVDSDTDSDDNRKQSKPKKPMSPIKKRQESMHKYMQKKPILQQNSKSEGSTVVQKSEDILKDSWATPALDDFCSEYFKSVQHSTPSQQTKTNSISGSKVSRPYSSVSEIGGHFQHESTSTRVGLEENLTDNHPPAMHYFCHRDQMVQNLVRERLKHFVPIGAGTSEGNEYSVEENLNYSRSQFGQSSGANDRWVTPNSRTSVPTDFGKRRVHAGGSQSGSGHWFTGEDGRKVYVSKNGQELTGRDAYKQYKKESGKGFRNFKKKKSTVKKEGSARAKRGSSTANKASSSSTAKRSSGAKRKR
ncbi:uncharacterized protein LOC119365730 isoform X1 [Triticum dicoccoides]|uniref:uncharacterized protein LOC119365730 isoform X1 n=1 Tax=Triticum dicoccoides TaxID=85692 RepID=UPI00188F2758|nr:uncharacterized protein LOC119365730 isoform X1 [Triticum dicoccoides]